MAKAVSKKKAKHNGRKPSNKSKDSKVKKLIKIASKRPKKEKKGFWFFKI